MLNIVCVNAGNYLGRGSQYVNTLFDMVRRNLPEGFQGKFVCFTDNPEGLDKGIHVRELPTDLKGWWNKLYLFKRGVFNEGERVLYFDLDTVIVGRLDEIAAYHGEFAILRDLFAGTSGAGHIFGEWQSAVMMWRGGFGAHLWESFESQGRPDALGGDQVFIRDHQETADILQDLYPDLFVSYKATGGVTPKKASVVCFHGRPRPHEVMEGWVPMVWKVGGVARAELDTICNTDLSRVHNQIRSSVKLKLPWLSSSQDHDRHVCIVGGGPWLSDALEEIRAMREFGHEIWTLNNTHDWLIERGINPDACLILDAREENAKFVQKPLNGCCYYIASQCHKSVFKALKGKNVVLYHNASEGVQELLETISPYDKYHLIGGGTTVGMKALAIARFKGFKAFHLYGMDSCYREDKHHAYPQSLNDGERVLDIICEGRNFKCAPWMVTQANDFQELARILTEQDCLITVHGDGLLGHVARMLARDAEPDTKIIEIDGLWWPSKDREARPAVISRAEDIAHILAACTGNKVAIQAGGNCGVWPQLMAKFFTSVYTFEPDWLNFRCLVHNATAENIIKFQAALGNAREPIELVRYPVNCGMHRVGGAGSIPQMRIDDLGLSACDLIQLDIEGYELHALKGAEKTIKQFHPVIVIEENGSSDKYGISSGMAGKWLKQFGYCEHSRIHRDIIFTHQTHIGENYASTS